MIQRVGVVGAGTMGAGIAQLCAQSGFAVKVHDPVPAALEALPARLKKSLDGAVLRGKLTTLQAERAFQSVSAAPRLEDLNGADLIIEAAPEVLELKQDLFARLAASCEDAVFATNTSSLSVAAIMAKVPDQSRTLGLHFFNPPVAMKLVEMIRTDKTSPELFRDVWEFTLMGLRRTPVDVKDVPGFIVNRVMRPYYVTSQRVVSGEASFAAVDAAARESGGVPMGPFELMDLIGLDVNLSITKAIFEALGRPERFTPPELQSRLVAKGATGRKAGKGFYLYQDGKAAGENPEALALLAPSGPDAAAAWKTLAEALAAEADRVVAEGTAGAADIDTAIKLAMNFPRGPFDLKSAAR